MGRMTVVAALLLTLGGPSGIQTQCIGRMQQPDGPSTKKKARRSMQTVNGLLVTDADVTGTYVAEMGLRRARSEPRTPRLRRSRLSAMRALIRSG